MSLLIQLFISVKVYCHCKPLWIRWFDYSNQQKPKTWSVSAPAGEVRLYPAFIRACNGFDGELKGLSRGYATTLRGTIKVTDNNRYAAPIAAWLQTEAKTAHLLPGKCMRFKGSANKRHRLWHKNGTEVRVNSFFSSRLAYKPKRSVGNRCLYLGWMRRCQFKMAIKHLSRKYDE